MKIKTTKYQDLTEALKQAKAASDEIPTSDVGGTCNFDSPDLTLIRWNHQKTTEAIEAAGLSGYYSESWKAWIIGGFGGAQGSNRTIKAETASKKLQELGYDAGMYYAMD